MDDLKQHLLGSITGPLWEKIGIVPHHGINLSLSALHSERSSGIGEFYDLIPIIDWCKKIGLDVIQLLPLNNSEEDPSPYNAISSCAINFVHLTFHALPFLEQAPNQQKKLKDLVDLTKPQRIPYQEVLTQKLVWLHGYFEEVGEGLTKSTGFQDFVTAHPWVEPYALYRALKDHLGRAPWTTWPNEVKSPSPEEYNELIKIYWPKIAFYIALQYLCYLQLKYVKEYANEQGVSLMGDIPILLSPDSADVWRYPEYFDINLAAGAPPDPYNLEGQYWGFPLFRWDVMRKNQFEWWKQRLHYAANFFDLYRVDHVIGFFRIWTIPLGHPSKEGYFLPAEEHLWEAQGRELLKMLVTSSSMLPIAEDLGTVPNIVRPILQEMGICGTKVMRWMREWEQDQRFIPIQHYPPLSLTTVSTHDSPTLQQWWKTYPEEAGVYAQSKHWQYQPDLSIPQRHEILWESHHTPSLFHINLLQEYLALFPDLIWPNPDDERINIPGHILPTNWTYRFRPSVEEIIAHEPLAQAIKRIVSHPTPDPTSI
jgi:4-alpha-glucanotransferase